MNQDPSTQWFTEALRRKMLRSINSWNPDDAPAAAQYREVVTKATTVGELINVLYYDWSLHNDISQLVDTINEACNERDIDDPQLTKIVREWVDAMQPEIDVYNTDPDVLRGYADCMEVMSGTADSDVKYTAAVFVRGYLVKEVAGARAEFGALAPSEDDYAFLAAEEDDLAYLTAYVGRYENPKGS